MELVAQKFKQTDIGLIPNDWSIKTISEAFEIHNHLRLPLSDAVRKNMQGDFPYYGPTKIQDYINEYRVEGEYALIGEDGDHFLKWNEFAMTQIASGRFNVNNHAHLVKGKSNITLTKWFYWFFKNRDITQYLTRQGAGRYKLSKASLLELPCAIPPTLEEQAAIATALSDADKYISSLEKLIAKKRLIKQGAMQQLLSPKENWVVKKLGEISEIYTGKKNNQDKVENGQYPFYVRSQTVERINSYSFDGEAILVPGEGNIGKIFHYINGKFDYHQRVYKISDFKNGFDGKYIYRYLSEYFGKHAMENSVKATVDSLRLPTFQAFEIPFPPKLEEQIEIATILGDIDAEISTLEKQFSKAQNIKQGMMEQLLTGKIRLV
jgi:type I restriction enzyme S subunit